MKDGFFKVMLLQARINIFMIKHEKMFIYVAATVMLALKVDREDLLEPVEGELVDDLP